MAGKKEKFRRSKEWRKFRKKVALAFGNKDYLTGKRLSKGYNVHHLKSGQEEEGYCDISNQSEFMPLNPYSHKLLHYIFTYYKKDRRIIDRLVEVLDKMIVLNPNFGVQPVDGMENAFSDESRFVESSSN